MSPTQAVSVKHLSVQLQSSDQWWHLDLGRAGLLTAGQLFHYHFIHSGHQEQSAAQLLISGQWRARQPPATAAGAFNYSVLSVGTGLLLLLTRSPTQLPTNHRPPSPSRPPIGWRGAAGAAGGGTAVTADPATCSWARLLRLSVQSGAVETGASVCQWWGDSSDQQPVTAADSTADQPHTASTFSTSVSWPGRPTPATRTAGAARTRSRTTRSSPWWSCSSRACPATASTAHTTTTPPRGSRATGATWAGTPSRPCPARTTPATPTSATPPVSPPDPEKVKNIFVKFNFVDALQKVYGACSSRRPACACRAPSQTGIKATYLKVAFICNYSNFGNYLFSQFSGTGQRATVTRRIVTRAAARGATHTLCLSNNKLVKIVRSHFRYPRNSPYLSCDVHSWKWKYFLVQDKINQL